MQKVSPQKTPMVVGKLLDLDCSEDFIRQLLNSVGHQCPVDDLVEQVSLLISVPLVFGYPPDGPPPPYAKTTGLVVNIRNV